MGCNSYSPAVFLIGKKDVNSRLDFLLLADDHSADGLDVRIRRFGSFLNNNDLRIQSIARLLISASQLFSFPLRNKVVCNTGRCFLMYRRYFLPHIPIG